MDGERLASAGFDAVLSNPPYVRVQNLRHSDPQLTSYLINGERYTTAEGRFDIYAPFVEQGSQLAAEGRLCYILPNKFIESGGGKPFRHYLLENDLLSEITDFGRYQMFQDVTTYTCILSLYKGKGEFDYAQVSGKIEGSEGIRSLERVSMNSDSFSTKPWVLAGPHEQKVLNQIENVSGSLGEVSQKILQGMKSGDNVVLFPEILDWGETIKIRSPVSGDEYTVESDLIRPIVLGDGIQRYQPPKTDLGVIYPYEQKTNQTAIIPERQLENQYPLTYGYLDDFRERLTDRRSEHMRYETWYALNRPREKSFFEEPKIIVPDISGQSEFTLDDKGEYYLADTVYSVVLKQNTPEARGYFLSILNSSITWFYIYQTGTVLRGDFRRFKTAYLSPLPVPTSIPENGCGWNRERFDEVVHEYSEYGELPDEDYNTVLSFLGHSMSRIHQSRDSLNLDLLDYLGTYDDGPTLGEMPYQPASGLAESILTETGTESDFETLRVTGARVERGGGRLRVLAVPYVKLTGEDEYETNSRGYATLEAVPAMEFVGMDEAQADLIEAFVPYAVAEAGGFAGYRDGATKTISPLDRLEGLTPPKLADVEGGVGRCMDARERAAELDEKIERTDALIDEIVYELYGLTEEEIAIVEDAVGE